MLLFRSEEHIAHWLSVRGIERGGTMTPEQCWRLADAWYANRMNPGYTRRTPAEAQALFNEIGLLGEFWRLA